MTTHTLHASGNTRLTGQHVDYHTLDLRDDDKTTLRVPRRDHLAMGQPTEVTVTVGPDDEAAGLRARLRLVEKTMSAIEDEHAAVANPKYCNEGSCGGCAWIERVNLALAGEG